MRFGLLAVAILLPAIVGADALININTADATLLDTLPGIGPTKAAAIIDYRNAHGPFARIEDIQNVSGIGSSTYADIAPLITVGISSTPLTATSTETVSGGGAATYVPPPTTISMYAGPDTVAYLEVPLTLTAIVKDKNGNIYSGATVLWSFGDGSMSEGRVVEKTYHYKGTYAVVATAKDGSAVARDEVIVVVESALPRIVSISGEGVVLANDAPQRLDLSGWRLYTDTGLFLIPEGTTVLPNAQVLLPYTIMNLSSATHVELRYPSGAVAAQYAPPAPSSVTLSFDTVQPAVNVASYNKAQTVETIISTNLDIQTHEEAVDAPTAAIELAAVGAVPPSQNGNQSNPLLSPWMLGLLGVIVLAGAVFIFL